MRISHDVNRSSRVVSRRTRIARTAVTTFMLSAAFGCGASAPAEDNDSQLGKVSSAICKDKGEAVDVVDSCDFSLPADPTKFTVSTAVYNHVDGADLAMDIAVPNTPGKHPLVVAIHGGGWAFGDRSIHADTIRLLASKGFVAASIDYRLVTYPGGGAGSYPAAAQDARCAVRWLRANAKTYGIDKNRVGTVGDSAGGHLASILGTENDVPGLDGQCSVKNESAEVSAVVAYYPVEDVRAPLTRWSAENTVFGIFSPQSFVIALLNGTPEDKPALAKLASPVAYVDKKDPPFLIINGAKDDVVPPAQERDMESALRSAKVPVTHIEFADQGHAFAVVSRDPELIKGTCTMVKFLDQELKHND